MRRSPGDGDRLRKYDDDTRLDILGPTQEADGRQWLPVRAPDGVEGWVPVEYTGPAPVPTETPTPAPAETPAVASSPGAADSTPDAAAGIVFGTVVPLPATGRSAAAVLVTNTSDQVRSLSVRATFLGGGGPLIVAAGSMTHLRPGEKRALLLNAAGSIPQQYDSVRLQIVARVAEGPSTAEAETATKISFGRPTIVPLGDRQAVQVAVTNGSDAPHTFTAQAAFLHGGELVGVAVGLVSDLQPGQTKTTSLIGNGALSADDEALLAVDTLLK